MRTSILLIAVVLLTTCVQAQETTAAHGQGISVVGVASAQIKPSVVEISAMLSADAELANDARIKERDARQRALDALEAKNPGVTLESSGISVNLLIDPNTAAMQRQQQIMIQNGVVVQGQNQADMNRRISVTEQVRLVLKDADKLETPKLVETVLRLIDTARESGLQFGPLNASNMSVYLAVQNAQASPLVICKATNTSAVREEAYKAAIEDARQKASQLADLTGVKIGKVIGIQELDAMGGAIQSTASIRSDAGISSSVIGKLSLNVRLGVQFEIVK